MSLKEGKRKIGYWQGKRLTEEHKRKISEGQKRIGNKPPNLKGYKFSKEHNEKISK